MASAPRVLGQFGLSTVLTRIWPSCDKSAMPKRSSKVQVKEDENEVAARILRELFGVTKAVQQNNPEIPLKNPAAVALGRMGGLKGGKARAKSLSATKRAQIAKKAAQARWGKR